MLKNRCRRFAGWLVDFPTIVHSTFYMQKKNICVRILTVDFLTLRKAGFKQIRCWRFGGWLVDFTDSEHILHSTLYMLKYRCRRFAGWLVDFPTILHSTCQKKKLYVCVFWRLTGWLYGKQALDKLGVGILVVDLLTSRIVSTFYILHCIC